MRKNVSMNFLPLNFFGFPANTAKQPPKPDTSIFFDKKFIADRGSLATLIETTVLKKLDERIGSPFQITDTAAIRDSIRKNSLTPQEAVDRFLIASIKANIDCIKIELSQQIKNPPLISQAAELAELSLNESAANPGHYRNALLGSFTI